jgi:hypothetical protein
MTSPRASVVSGVWGLYERQRRDRQGWNRRGRALNSFALVSDPQDTRRCIRRFETDEWSEKGWRSWYDEESDTGEDESRRAPFLLRRRSGAAGLCVEVGWCRAGVSTRRPSRRLPCCTRLRVSTRAHLQPQGGASVPVLGSRWDAWRAAT